MQRIALIGITGRAGSRIASELLARGHRVTGIARDTSSVPPRDGLTTVSADATRREVIAPLLAGHDVVVSAARFDGGPDADTLLAAVRQAGVPRLLVVGGAGSLEVAPGVALIDTPGFPDAYRAEAGAQAACIGGGHELCGQRGFAGALQAADAQHAHIVGAGVVEDACDQGIRPAGVGS